MSTNNPFDDLFGETNATYPNYVDFDYPALAWVCSMHRTGVECVEMVSLMNNHKNNLPGEITSDDVQLAQDIYDYFSKKHTMRRLKGEYVSPFMLKVDDLCERKYRVSRDLLPALSTLPRIYKQNKQLESIIKNRRSVNKGTVKSNSTVEISFVDKVDMKFPSGRKGTDYYWSTPSNYLVRIRLVDADAGKCAWEYLSTLGKLKIKSSFFTASRVKGYEFYAIQPSDITHIEPLEV
jgi:hypothetical protein